MVELIVKVQKEDFDINEELEILKNQCDSIPGAISIFTGYVRDFSKNKFGIIIECRKNPA